MEKSYFDRGFKELRDEYSKKFGEGKNPGLSREALAFELTLQKLKECFVAQYKLIARAAPIGIK